MSPWSHIPKLLADEDIVLVSVAATRGSAPREAGASMLVTPTRVVDTIGGGHLEWEAIAQARAMLLQGEIAPQLQRYALAASLGQCCGGVVWLAFEYVAQSQRKAWHERLGQLASGRRLRRSLSGTDAASRWQIDDGNSASAAEIIDASTRNGHDWRFTHTLAPPSFCLTVFGAGHVGAALVRLLAPLEMRIRWVDQREDLLVGTWPNVECLVSDVPEDAVASAPPGSAFVVLTHDHALDLALSKAILHRGDAAWFGLIGSKSKRARFEHRLAAQGIAPERLAQMHCPIGVAGIADKSPQAIAIAVAAQILIEVERTPRSLAGEGGMSCVVSDK